MGAGPSSTGGGGRTDAGPKRTTATKIGVGNINEKGQKTKTTFTKEDDNRDKNKVVTPNKKTDFKPVTKEVLNPNNNDQIKKKTPIITPDNDGGDNQVTEKKLPIPAKAAVEPNTGETLAKTAPTEAEVSQSETANADAQALKVKKRGRSRSIMTSAKGVTKTSSDYSLGRPSLLGRV